MNNFSCFRLNFKNLKFCLGDVAGKRDPPNATRTKHVPQTINQAPFGKTYMNTRNDCVYGSSKTNAANMMCAMVKYNYWSLLLGFFSP
jgi:hypothetical protein